MTKTEMLESIVKARKLLDPIYYAFEDSNDPIKVEICRLMSWADSSLMEAEYEVDKLGE